MKYKEFLSRLQKAVENCDLEDEDVGVSLQEHSLEVTHVSEDGWIEVEEEDVELVEVFPSSESK